MKALNNFYAIKIEQWSVLQYLKGYDSKVQDNLGIETTFHRNEPSKESLIILFKTALQPVEVGSVKMTLFYNHKELKQWKYDKSKT